MVFLIDSEAGGIWTLACNSPSMAIYALAYPQVYPYKPLLAASESDFFAGNFFFNSIWHFLYKRGFIYISDFFENKFRNEVL